MGEKEKKGQVAIYIIIALVIVAGVLVYLFVIKGMGQDSDTRNFPEVYNYYLECIQGETENAIKVSQIQGGRMNNDYIPGSEYAPFSNQLNFLGIPVSYWFYVSGNGIVKENVPTKNEIEREIEEFVEEGVGNCNFDEFYENGYEISNNLRSVRVNIESERVKVEVDANLVVSKDEITERKGTHLIEVSSKFGKLYNAALGIYNKQKDQAFLEEYGVDVLRLYAPVDGTEISCSPKIWRTAEVTDELKQGLEANIAALRFGNKKDVKSDYFVIDHNPGFDTNFIYSSNWPTKIEIDGEGVDQELIVAEPVGNQAGLGIMGFCYVPYHYVYDLVYPVMIQVYDGEEIFQFPVTVIIDNNQPRIAELTDAGLTAEVDLCMYKDKEIEVNLYDINLNGLDGRISYECFDQTCHIGNTNSGTYVGVAPTCVNGYIIANVPGYSTKKQLMSTNRESVADMILDKEYRMKVELDLSGSVVSSDALAIFSNNETGKSVTALYPGSEYINLSEGAWTVSVYVYSNSSINLPGSTRKECREVPRSGLLGIFGANKEECFDIIIPESRIETALIGGGSNEFYALPMDLESGRIRISGERLPRPTSLEDLQNNFLILEDSRLGVDFG